MSLSGMEGRQDFPSQHLDEGVFLEGLVAFALAPGIVTTTTTTMKLRNCKGLTFHPIRRREYI